MAPMSTQLSEEGNVSARQIAFYRERARGGTGLIIVEFCCVHSATGRSGHRRLVEAINSEGAIAAIQLQHGGPGARRALVEGGVAIGPSDRVSRRDPSKLTCRAMT